VKDSFFHVERSAVGGDSKSGKVDQVSGLESGLLSLPEVRYESILLVLRPDLIDSLALFLCILLEG
jgi:hypothetical protein